jgi:hypothetical protein
LVSSAALCGEFHVYLNNTDHVSGKELTLGEGGLSLLTPYCGKMLIQRSAVKGVSANSERASEILTFAGENDVVHNRNGDRLSGKVVEMKRRPEWDWTKWIT